MFGGEEQIHVLIGRALPKFSSGLSWKFKPANSLFHTTNL